METKLCVSLCALLLLGLGSAVRDLEHGVSTPSTTTSGRDLDPASTQAAQVDSEVAQNNTKVNQNDTTTNPQAGTPLLEEATSAPSPPIFTTSKTGSDTNGNLTATSKPPDVTTVVSSNEFPSSTSTPQPIKPTITATSSDSLATSDPNNKTHMSTSTLTPEHTPVPNNNPVTNVATISLPASSTLVHNELTTQFHKAPTKPTSVTTMNTEIHADTPSKLNMKGDTTKDHVSPSLDPLLAGLVSAFIITALIITLLLFLKLRRRDTRPEFRRLQDLPMDDMMEDTPLSMYSY